MDDPDLLALAEQALTEIKVNQGLSAGRYSLSANKSGHVGVSYGATRPGRPGTPATPKGSSCASWW